MSIELGVRQSSQDRLGVLAALVGAQVRDGRRSVHVLEVGSYEGESALHWSQVIAERAPEGGTVTCVDPWQPYHSQAELTMGVAYSSMDSDLRSGAAFDRFRKNIEHADPRAPIFYLRATLDEALWQGLRGRLFDLVYLDGDHRYQAVKRDILLAQPLVRTGGFLCGDDLERQLDGSQADDEAAAVNGEVDYVNSVHWGVSRAVHEVFGRVWCSTNVWAMRSGADGAWLAEFAL